LAAPFNAGDAGVLLLRAPGRAETPPAPVVEPPADPVPPDAVLFAPPKPVVEFVAVFELALFVLEADPVFVVAAFFSAVAELAPPGAFAFTSLAAPGAAVLTLLAAPGAELFAVFEPFPQLHAERPTQQIETAASLNTNLRSKRIAKPRYSKAIAG
jgi:hypothetical protein